MARVGIVTGLASEAECIGGAFKASNRDLPDIRIAAARPDRAEAEARALIDGGCDALVSIGLAGGLDPALRPGDLVIAETIIGRGPTSTATPLDWRQSAAALIGGGEGSTRQGIIAGVDTPVSTRRDKCDLAARTGAIAVDMESHRVARVAAEHGRPMLAIRAVADPANREIPAWAIRAVDRDGGVRGWPVVLNLIVRPWQIAVLMKLASDSDIALKRLGRVALRLGPGFGLPR